MSNIDDDNPHANKNLESIKNLIDEFQNKVINIIILIKKNIQYNINYL